MGHKQNNAPTTPYGEWKHLTEIGPEEWAARHNEGRVYWALLQGKPVDRARLLERIKELRELYDRAKADPKILKPWCMSLVDIELCLIQNLKWLKAGGEQYDVKYAVEKARSDRFEAMLKNQDKFKSGSVRSQRGRSSRKK